MFTEKLYLQEAHSLSGEQAGLVLRKKGIDSNSSESIDRLCPWTPSPDCVLTDRYRTFDGRCNNLFEVNYGRAMTPFQRMELPQYAGMLNTAKKMIT